MVLSDGCPVGFLVRGVSALTMYINCDWCNQEFCIEMSRIRKNHLHYCSTDCQYEHRRHMTYKNPSHSVLNGLKIRGGYVVNAHRAGCLAGRD